MASNEATPKRPIKIASSSAYSGDRLDALASVLSGPIEVDAIVGDYLAEMNLFWRKAEMDRQPGAGHDPTFVKTLEAARTQLGQRLHAGTFPKLVVNAGALNPQQLAIDIQQFLTSEFGDRGRTIKIAYVTGDDVLHLTQDPDTRAEITHLTTSETLDKWTYEPVIANAYIGQYGFVAALRDGADIVIAGRTTDAGSVQALATWYYGWTEDDFDNHALGLIAGHLIECGHYVVRGFQQSAFERLSLTTSCRQVANFVASNELNHTFISDTPSRKSTATVTALSPSNPTKMELSMLTLFAVSWCTKFKVDITTILMLLQTCLTWVWLQKDKTESGSVASKDYRLQRP